MKIASNQSERDWAYLQTAIAHYKANQWNKVHVTLDKMDGEQHQSLSGQLRRAAKAKIKAENLKP